MRYELYINQQRYAVQSTQELTSYLAEALRYQNADIALYQISDEPPHLTEKLLYKSVGLVPPTYIAYLSALTNGSEGLAFMTFVDDKDNTFYSVNPGFTGSWERKIAFVLNNRQKDEYLAGECVAMGLVLRAFDFFFETGRKPEGINWRQT